MRKYSRYLFYTLPWAFFLIFALRDIDLPGLYMDEINHGAFMPAVLDKEAANKPHFRLKDNILENRLLKSYRYPILGGSAYNTTLKAYTAIPFYKALGFSVYTHRLYEVFIGALLVLFFQLFLSYAIKDNAISCLTVTCFSIDPLLTFQMRSQAFSFVYLLAACFIYLYFLTRQKQSTSSSPKIHYAAMGVSAGAACITYFTSLATLAVPLLVGAWEAIKRERLRCLTFFFFITILPFLYAIISLCIQSPKQMTNFGMPKFALEAQEKHTDSIPQKLFKTGAELSEYYNTSSPLSYTGVKALPASKAKSAILIIAIITTTIVLIYRLIQTKKNRADLHYYFLSIGPIYSFLILSTLLASIRNHHFLSVLPFSYICLGLSCYHFSTLLKGTKEKYSRLLSATPLIALLAINFSHQNVVSSALRDTGGIGFFNQKVSHIHEFAESIYPDERIVFTDWGYHLTYLFLTAGLREYDVRFSAPDVWLNEYLDKHEKLLACSTQKTSEILYAELVKLEPKSIEQKTLYTRDGKPFLVFTRAQLKVNHEL